MVLKKEQRLQLRQAAYRVWYGADKIVVGKVDIRDCPRRHGSSTDDPVPIAFSAFRSSPSIMIFPAASVGRVVERDERLPFRRRNRPPMVGCGRSVYTCL